MKKKQSKKKLEKHIARLEEQLERLMIRDAARDNEWRAWIQANFNYDLRVLGKPIFETDWVTPVQRPYRQVRDDRGRIVAVYD